jgi:CheY-like chemotaxis protein
MVAHDLNNSLLAMMGWADILKITDGSDTDEALQCIEQSAEYAEVLVEDLQHKKATHAGESLDLALVVSRARSIIEATLRRKVSVPLELDVRPEEGCFVEILPHSVRRLLLNLVANARDAMAERGGRCSVVLQKKETEVELLVEDTGCGMAEATRAKVFEAFFSTKEGRGTGLGLHSVAEIVTSTKGQIHVSSTLGVGSRFTLRWPLAKPPRERMAAPVSTRRAPGGVRLLLAEDEPAVRRLLRRGLEEAGYTVVEAADGDEAARLLHTSEPFDALCTDMVMPGRPSSQLVNDFATQFPGRPMVVMSGHLLEEHLPSLALSRDVTWLSKPFTVARLVAVLTSRASALASAASSRSNDDS